MRLLTILILYTAITLSEVFSDLVDHFTTENSGIELSSKHVGEKGYELEIEFKKQLKLKPTQELMFNKVGRDQLIPNHLFVINDNEAALQEVIIPPPESEHFT